MRAAVLERLGVPAPGEFDEPRPADGVAIVQVDAAGLNPVDLAMAAGAAGRPPLPSVAGREGVGRVDGRRVYFGTTVDPFGAMAERAPVPVERLYDLPDEVEDGVAIALGVAGLAAWLGLERRAGLERGEHVLVLGASGVVGQVAVQAARILGAARVVAAARRVERVRELGADAVVALDTDDADVLADRFREATGGRLDVIVDPLWGPPALAALRAATAGGRLVQLGHSAAPELPLAPGFMRGTLVSILGFSTRGVPKEVRRDAYLRAVAHAARGEIRVPSEAHPLADVQRAWARQRLSPGTKLLVVP